MATVGHAYLKIMPSLEGLGTELRRQIRESERGTPPVRLGTELRTARVHEQIRELARDGDATAVTLAAQLDRAEAETQFQILLRRLSGRSVQIKVGLDRSVGATIRGAGQLNNAVLGLTGRLPG